MAGTLRIGSGAGFSGDRLDAAVNLLERGDLDVLALECLAERTIALAQLRRRNDPSLGYDPRLARRIEPLLLQLRKRGVRLLSNLGAANPIGAGDAIVSIARRLGVPVKVAVVTGDDVLDRIEPDERSLEGAFRCARTVRWSRPTRISAPTRSCQLSPRCPTLCSSWKSSFTRRIAA